MKPFVLLALLGVLGTALFLSTPAPADPTTSGVPVADMTLGDAPLRPAQTAYTVNGVLGDASFVAAFGRLPGPGDAEDLRLVTHLAYIERLLRSRDVSHLAPALQAARARNLDRLHAYWTAGVFPRNTVVPDRRMPVFIDAAGRICAVGYLLEQDLGREAAEAVNQRFETATVFEIDDPALADWLATSGLTLEEAAMIQPAYGPGINYTYRFDTDGPTVCGTNENPTPDIFGASPGFSVSEFERMPGLTCAHTTDDVFESTGFSADFDPNRALRFTLTYSEDQWAPLEAGLTFMFWRSDNGPAEGRLLFSLDGGTTFEEVVTFDINTTLSVEAPFLNFPPDASPGDDVIFTIEARGGDPSGSFMLDLFHGITFYTPVELTAFTARLDGPVVHLDWATASETNNAGFEVQMHREGQSTFEPLGFIEGHGTTTEAQTYTYTVPDLEPGTYTFRLKQIDFDGRFEYHGDVEVTVAVPGTYVLSEAYPNPFNPQARFTLAVAETQPVRVSVYDALGRRVADLFDGVLDGGRAHPFALDGSGLASGLHVIRVVGASFAATQTVTLVR